MREIGQPAERARAIAANPVGALKRYAGYFDTFQGVRVANICGSCGKKAVPLALLGARVTVFDISEDNCRYAMELAGAAGATLDDQVCDVLEIDMARYAGAFDVVFMEGGVLLCSDFHPFTKVVDALELQQPTMSCCSTEAFEGEMAHARFYTGEERRRFPPCVYRKYTLGETINGAIGAGFVLCRFDEHPSWARPDLPGEVTLVADRAEGTGEGMTDERRAAHTKTASPL